MHIILAPPAAVFVAQGRGREPTECSRPERVNLVGRRYLFAPLYSMMRRKKAAVFLVVSAEEPSCVIWIEARSVSLPDAFTCEGRAIVIFFRALSGGAVQRQYIGNDLPSEHR